MPDETLILRDITAQTNNEKRGRGRPRKQPIKVIEHSQVIQDLQKTQEDAGEKSGQNHPKISEEHLISNFQSISSVMNNVDERDDQKVS
jgi:hypothetical protein